MRRKGIRQAAAGLALLAAIGVGAIDVRAAGGALAAWNVVAVNASASVAKRTQAVSTIEVTIVQAAVYDAVNAIDGGHFKPYASLPPAQPWASADAAIATAAHDVLVWLYPPQAGDLDLQLAASLADIPEGTENQAGIAVGAAAAQGVIAARASDGRDANVSWTPPQGPGAWQPTFPAYAAPQTPWVAVMKPFTMSSASQFRPAAPPALASDEYATSLNETEARGAKTGATRTAAETAQALFWSDNFTVQYNRYLRTLAGEQGLSVADAARLLAMVNMAAADALIGCMDGKYAYGFWRPITAIPAAAGDGNPATSANPDWLPLLTTPNHPEYPSAHACGSMAVTETLAAFFGTDRVPSTITSTVAGAGAPRAFERFKDLYADVHEARILGGLHYRFSMNAGRALGAKVARQLVRTEFVRID
jgi:hypothetical protein